MEQNHVYTLNPDDLEEIQKCRENPYYFAITYLQIKRQDGTFQPFTTLQTENEFNQEYWAYQLDKLRNQ